MSLGKTSTIISLPRKWLEINNLKKGSLVNMSIHRNGSLIVSPVIEEAEQLKEIHFSIFTGESSNSIIRKIVACSLNGYNRITLTSKVFTEKQQQAIRKIVSVLYMMLEEAQSGRVVLRSLVDESKTSLTSCVERMHAITSSMCNDLITVMSNNKLELAKSILSIEADVDQLEFLVFRLIHMAVMSPSVLEVFGMDQSDCLDYQTLTHRIDRIADDVELIAINVCEIIETGSLNSDTKIPDSIIRLAQEVFKNYGITVSNFLSGKLTNVNEIIEYEDDANEIIREIYQQLSEMRHDEKISDIYFISCILISDSLRKITHYTADIAELCIGRAYKQTLEKKS